MPKTNIRGGNKKKKGKNGLTDLNRTLDYALEGQLYGQISKTLGGSRFLVKCFDKDPKNNEFILKEKICHVCGKMRKKVWINDNDLILLSVREFDETKGDIIHKYTNDEARKLKKKKLIPNIELVNGKVESNEVNFEYSNQILGKKENKINKNEPYLVIDITDSEEDIDEL